MLLAPLGGREAQEEVGKDRALQAGWNEDPEGEEGKSRVTVVKLVCDVSLTDFFVFRQWRRSICTGMLMYITVDLPE
jgi:hypothetical protein